MRTTISILFVFVALAAVTAGRIDPAFGQTQTSPGATKQSATKPPVTKSVRPGNVCVSSKLSGGAGIVKVDLCNRPYCGSTIVAKPYMKIDYDRKCMPCEFTMVGNRCRCIPIANDDTFGEVCEAVARRAY